MNRNFILSFLFTLFAFCFIMDSYAQTILTYTYDHAGNRIQKKIIILKSAFKQQISDSSSLQRKMDEKDIPFEENVGQLSVKICPNPVNSLLNIKITGIEKNCVWDYYLISINGRLITKSRTSADNENINFSYLQPGMYLLRMEVNNNIFKWIIIKE